ncbi:hypothetical protein [[Leptolyngbya] sp. PCC 7376]|uniref:hypothetical protein n=1 Tax=[Leptolyngbya] sp. PCC 7376 TaxID=111781 RepID=UPI00030DE375|nr:hypothetical protein [[Leptolyngbya] sp. PCC 7376]
MANQLVSVSKDKEKLRLRYRYKGKVTFLYLGLTNTPPNAAKAEQCRYHLEQDLLHNRYEHHHRESYRPEFNQVNEFFALPLDAQFEEWLDTLTKNNDHHKAVLEMLQRDKPRSLANIDMSRYAPKTYNTRLSYLRSFQQWLIDEGVLDKPILKLEPKKTKKTLSGQRKPLNNLEIESILCWFAENSDQYYE